MLLSSSTLRPQGRDLALAADISPSARQLRDRLEEPVQVRLLHLVHRLIADARHRRGGADKAIET